MKHSFQIPLLLLLVVSACASKPQYPEPVITGRDISVDLDSLSSGIPKYFSYSGLNVKISFFVVKMDDRVISFLDACTKCYPQKKGFSFDSGSVICRACDERYPLSEIEHGFASCYPIKLQGRVEHGKYLISVAELEKTGAKYFR